MELEFETKDVPFLKDAVREVQNLEGTQEIKLSDGFPDVGRVLSAWGQAIVRGKEWRSDSILLIGGVMAWVLYLPEDGSGARTLNTWIPIQMKWDLPENTPEGTIRATMLLRSVDARTVSPRKVMVRCSVGALGEAWCPEKCPLPQPRELPEDIALLRRKHTLWVPEEAGEKPFRMEETLSPSGPQPEKLLYYTMTPEILDRKVMTDKVVFRGSGNLHILYAGEDGALTSQDFALPFSQFGELTGSYSSAAKAEIQPVMTELEVDIDDDGAFRLKAAAVGQYLVKDSLEVETVEDAYSPLRNVTANLNPVSLATMPEGSTENVVWEQNIPGGILADVSVLPDFPRLRPSQEGGTMVCPGMYQALFYGEDGSLQASSGHIEAEKPFSGEGGFVLPGRTQCSMGGGVTLRAEMPVTVYPQETGTIPVASGLSLGEQREPDPDRPSLILCRAGSGGLWETAKATGSTMEAIAAANGLEGEPDPGKMLLIPIS